MALLKTIISLPGKIMGGRNKPQVSATQKDMRGSDFIDLQDRMLVGVLYTVSHNIFGEIYPVYVGRNTIGREADCDITLREDSIEAAHAVLLVRRTEDSDGKLKMTVSICDDSPGCEISVNGERLDFEHIYCNDGDRIRIGLHYELILKILTPETCNLQPDDQFVALQPINRSNLSVVADENFTSSGYAPSGMAENYRDSIGEEDERSFYAPSKGRVTSKGTNQTIIEK